MNRLTLALVVLIGGALLYFGRRLAAGAQAAADAIAEPIADLYVGLVAEPAVSVSAGAVLPGGARVTFDAIIEAGSGVDRDNKFSWAGVRYRLTGRRADGWYDAVRASA